MKSPKPKSRHCHAPISTKEGFWNQGDGSLTMRALFGSTWGKKAGFFYETYKKITANTQIWRPEQQSFALISCTAQAIQPNLVMSASVVHSLLDLKISLEKAGIFMKNYTSCRSHRNPLGFFPKVNLPFLKEERKKKDKTCLISNPKVFSINIFNENSFPSVGIHPGGTLLQNTCPPWSLLRKNTLFLIPKPRLFPNNKRTSRLSEAQMIQPQELFFSHWLENIVMKKSELKKKITSIFPINEDLHRNVERILKQSILMLLAAGPLSRTKM